MTEQKFSAEYIDSLKTEKGGWTKASLELLGVPWPPPKGWRKKLIGESAEAPLVPGQVALKKLLTDFWKEFPFFGITALPEDKSRALSELSKTVVKYRKQCSLERRRKEFEANKARLLPVWGITKCFVCGNPATERHHIIQLQNGGINSHADLVPLCSSCHIEIHPWLRPNALLMIIA